MKRIEKIMGMGRIDNYTIMEKYQPEATHYDPIAAVSFEKEGLYKFLKWLWQDIPDPIRLTPEQEKAVRWLIEGGYEEIQNIPEHNVIDATTKDKDTMKGNAFFKGQMAYDVLINADWLTTELIELRGLVDNDG